MSIKHWLASFILLVLSGCSTHVIPYTPEPGALTESPDVIIEEVIMAQPVNLRPETIVVTNEYLMLDDGVVRETITTSHSTFSGSVAVGGVAIRAKERSLNVHLYFNALQTPMLYRQNEWYIVQLNNDSGQVVKRFYVRDQRKAEVLIDAITMKIQRAHALAEQAADES